jgi:hypothetical protein
MPMKNNTSMTMNLPNARANLGESAIRMRNKRIVCILWLVDWLVVPIVWVSKNVWSIMRELLISAFLTDIAKKDTTSIFFCVALQTRAAMARL